MLYHLSYPPAQRFRREKSPYQAPFSPVNRPLWSPRAGRKKTPY